VDVDVRDFVAWFWWTGMRPGEIRQLTWAMFDRETWTLNLDSKADKTRKGRVIAIEGPLREIIDRRLTKGSPARLPARLPPREQGPARSTDPRLPLPVELGA
jgi:integrase